MDLKPVEAVLAQWLPLGKAQYGARHVGPHVVQVRGTRVHSASEVHVVGQPEYVLAELERKRRRENQRRVDELFFFF